MSQAAPAVLLQSLTAAAAPASGTSVLHGVDLRIEGGEQVAIIGPSGAGKTSLLLAMACALKPLSGQMRLFGEQPWALTSSARQRLRGRLMLTPQVPPLPPRQRVATAVLAGRLPQLSLWRSLALSWSADEASRAHAALAAFDLGDKLWQRVDRLSGGERQRVGLARALVSEAELWLVDEPLSALDPARAAQAVASLQDAARANGRTLVCTLHQVDVALERFGRIVALQAGRVAYDGPPAGLDADRLHALYRGEAAPTSRDEGPRADEARLPESLCR
ncbi:phosphonate ABC transporter ATP-binding protein [Ideonella sp. YS5]|uniref:phosphonate ABC transporter ATP-binding protein n=1 Tax=Ideonella sp. YS5 TaxID=3453714 RepID=UPI003EE86319